METSTTAIPDLNEGEEHAFSLILPDGKTVHTILQCSDEEDMDWSAAVELAKQKGLDLPDRAEQALFHKYMPEKFQRKAYWSNTQHAAYSYYAWYQDFDYGRQYDYYGKSSELGVRLVRRVIIQSIQ